MPWMFINSISTKSFISAGSFQARGSFFFVTTLSRSSAGIRILTPLSSRLEQRGHAFVLLVVKEQNPSRAPVE